MLRAGRLGARLLVLAAAAAVASAASAVSAQTVVLSGSMGAQRALLLIDGTPQTLAVGETARGVTLERLAGDEAGVRVGGQHLTLRLGGAPSRLGTSGGTGGNGGSIVLPMGSGGHFVAAGTINGRTVQFLVDTGATSVALSQAEADRIGLDWRRGSRGFTSTANGVVPVVQLMLNSVRIGGVEVANVAAVVIPAEMPMVLLGNSFLSRFSMRRESDVMRLDKKP